MSAPNAHLNSVALVCSALRGSLSLHDVTEITDGGIGGGRQRFGPEENLRALVCVNENSPNMFSFQDGRQYAQKIRERSRKGVECHVGGGGGLQCMTRRMKISEVI